MFPSSSSLCGRILFATGALGWPLAGSHGHGTFHERVEALTAALREKPDDPGLLFRLATASLEHGEWESALRQLADLDRVAPRVVATDLQRGRALAAGGKFAEARAALDAYLALQPGHALALGARAEVLSELGQPLLAATDLAASIAATARPEPDVFLELAGFLVAAGQSAEAVRALDDGMGKLGAVPALIDRAIELELALGRAAAALARLDVQLAAAPAAQRPALMASRARLLATARRAAEARAAWEALREFLAALPPLDRASHAMLRLAAEAEQALAASTP